jgi:hypothetical protein
MAAGFAVVEVPDPNKITSFIEDTTGAMVAIFEVFVFFQRNKFKII